MPEIRVLEYLDPEGRSPYAAWFNGLNAPAAAKVAAALYQLASDNFSNVKGVGAGVFERKINFGPGYRVYFGKDGQDVVILLGGRHEAAPAAGDRDRKRTVGRVSPSQARWVTDPSVREA